MPKRLTRPFNKKTVTRKVIKQWVIDSRRGKWARPIVISKELYYRPDGGLVAVNEICIYVEKHWAVVFNRRHKCTKRSGRHKEKSSIPYWQRWNNND